MTLVAPIVFATCSVAECHHPVTEGTVLCGMHWMGLPTVLRRALLWDATKGWDKEGSVYLALHQSHVRLALRYYGEDQVTSWDSEE